jgi:DNA processing protein
LPLRIVEIGDEAYPARLLDLPRPPKRLWWHGDLDLLNGKVVAVVGTRRATQYGRRMTAEIAGALARAGVTVVSGMALGIDAVAHRAALDATGGTVAVLGTGADVAYPRAHVALHAEIAERGAVLSELPPGAHSHRGSFPERNRIIAALAGATIVIEAPLDSGALITANRALELGRDVAVIPGPIDSPQSQGSNALLRDGTLTLR